MRRFEKRTAKINFSDNFADVDIGVGIVDDQCFRWEGGFKRVLHTKSAKFARKERCKNGSVWDT